MHEMIKKHCALDYGSYRNSQQQRLRQVWAYSQTHQSLCCLHTQSMDVDEISYQNLDL